MRFYRGVVIASWKLIPISRNDDVKYRRHLQFLETTTVVESQNKISDVLWTMSYFFTALRTYFKIINLERPLEKILQYATPTVRHIHHTWGLDPSCSSLCSSEEFYELMCVHTRLCQSLCRIQNTWLWENYCFHRKKLRMMELWISIELFHGTRLNWSTKHRFSICIYIYFG